VVWSEIHQESEEDEDVILGRYVGAALIVVGLLFGVAILYGAYEGGYQLGLLRTWAAFGAAYLVGLLLASLCSGIAGSERLVRRAGTALLGLAALAGAALVLNKVGAVRLADTMQPWALLAACAVVGGVILFGSSS
jgi:hypothetical protein